MSQLRIFSQTMAALTGKADVFSRELVQWLRDLVDRVNALSSVGDFRVSTDPDPRVGELLADGSDVSRSDYASLFDLVGITFGPGNGTTTFTLPDMSTVMTDVYFFVRAD